MYVGQKTLGDLGRFKLRKIFRGNPLKRVVKNVAQKPLKQIFNVTKSAGRMIVKHPLSVVNPLVWGNVAAVTRNPKIADFAAGPGTVAAGAAAFGVPAPMSMPQQPDNLPVDSPAGQLLVDTGPGVNQMAPGYTTYPVQPQSDYYPMPGVPSQDGTYLSPDMQQASQSDPNAPAQPKTAAGGMGKGVLILGALGAAFLIWKRRNK